MAGDKTGPQPYHRTTSLEFLNRCSPKIASFYRFWESKLSGRRMPARGDFDPLEMKEWLPGIVLVDVEHDPLRLTYRLVGTRSVSLKQRDVTGQRVEEGYHGSSLDEILENYRQVIAGRCAVYDWEVEVSQDRHLEDSETLLLPLSNDGETVNMVMVYFELNPHLDDGSDRLR
ncbi:MAG TPA: PAS domain-containing protein [Terriglobales bacterium]|nr:PAS domain-containing protein [Terriglobales bacterium]